MRIIANGYTTMLSTVNQLTLIIFITVIQLQMQKMFANLALPCANPQSHHFNSFLYQYPQDGVINGHQPNKNNTFYVFDTECIQEVDNFQIYIDIFTNQTECLNTSQQDLLPISILIPKYIQNVPNHKVLIALFDSGGTISLIHKHMLLTEVTPSLSVTKYLLL